MQAVFSVCAPNGHFVSVCVNEWTRWSKSKRDFVPIMISDLFSLNGNNVWIDKKNKIKDDYATRLLRMRNNRIIRSIENFPGFQMFM